MSKSNSYTKGVEVELFKSNYYFYPEKHMTKKAWDWLVKTHDKSPLKALEALQEHVYPENRLNELFEGYFSSNAYSMLYENESNIIKPYQCDMISASWEKLETNINNLCYTFYPYRYITEDQWKFLVGKFREAPNPERSAYIQIMTFLFYPEMREKIFEGFREFIEYKKQADRIFNSYYGLKGGKSRRRKTRRKLTIKKRRT
jgi:hypothetical protein